MEKVNVDTWDITQIVISRETWVSGKPFKGNIRFRNRQDEEIAFNIPSDKLPGIIQMIAESSVESAKKIGLELSKCLPQVLLQTALLPAPVQEPESEPLPAPVQEPESEPDDLAF